MSRQEKKDSRNLIKRQARDLRSVACAVMGVAFGPVEVASRPYKDRHGDSVAPEAGELLLVRKAQGDVLVEKFVTARWEMTDNGGALLQRAA